jgi:diguanylate cyclase (GGDEF)-like protein
MAPTDELRLTPAQTTDSAAAPAAGPNHVERDGHVVLTIDIDRLDAYERLYGTQMGDRLMDHVAGKIAGNLRGDDVVVVRTGHGFTVVLSGPTSEADAKAVASRVARAIGDPCLVDGRRLHVIAHVSVTLPHGEEGAADRTLHLP